jgi:phosphatidate cytidylyltransferase
MHGNVGPHGSAHSYILYQACMKRILTAVVLIAVVVSLVLKGEPWMISILAGIVAALAAWEYRALAKQTDIYVPAWWLLAATAIIFFFTIRLPDFELPVLTLLTFILLAWSGFRAPLDRVLLDTSAGLFGLIYIVYPLTLLPVIKAHEDGTGLLIFLFVCVWSGDTAALYIGKNFGRRKLSPISPNKTWEGAVASVAAAVLFGMGIYYLGIYLSPRGYTALFMAIPAWQMVLLAIVLNIAAQLGDLMESAIKRGAGVKDSGTLLPGHGGILDRIDALLLAAPVLWYILLLKDWQTLFH